MKALSIHPYYASAIVAGQKTVEVRTWKTDYRGPIVICSTKHKYKGTVPGCALGTVELVDVVPLQKKHLKAALLSQSESVAGKYSWILADNKLIVPVPVSGKLSLWEYTGDLEYIPENEWVCDESNIETAGSWVQKYWGPYMT